MKGDNRKDAKAQSNLQKGKLRKKRIDHPFFFAPLRLCGEGFKR